MDFHNKKIVITGASPDFGQTIAILFAKMGAELFLSARTLEKANATADIVRDVAPKATVFTFRANVTKLEDIVQFPLLLVAFSSPNTSYPYCKNHLILMLFLLIVLPA